MSTMQAAVDDGRFSARHQPSCFTTGAKKRHGGTVRMTCPHCDSLAKVRSSRRLTPLFREFRFQCTDTDCGHTFVASMTIDRTIVQSARPNPRIKLPVAPPRSSVANDR